MKNHISKTQPTSEEEISSTREIEIKNIGQVLGVDSDGYIVKQVEKNIAQPWKDLTDEMKEIYRETLGNSLHSVYIRGSIARGTAIEGVSDADSIAVVKLAPGSFRDQQQLLREKAIGLENKYPFIIFAELQARPLQPILAEKNRIFKALLHTSAICTYGEDLSEILPRVKPGPESVIVAYNYSRVLNEAIERFSDPSFDIKPWHCRKLMRNTIRAGFETVMEKEQVWTRDLYPSYEYFSKNHPEYKDDMYEALVFALNPMTDREKVLTLANNLGRFVENEIEENL